jgi:hypothetical protein
MTLNKKKVIAIIILIALFFTIVIQARNLHSNFKKVKKPTIESRKLGNLGTYKWMTVQQISKQYGIEQNEVFKLLEISPKQGDEKLDIRTLGEKYKKTQEQMKSNIHKVLQQGIKNGKKS